MLNKDHDKLGNLIVVGGWVAAGGLALSLLGFFGTVLTGGRSMAALTGLGGLALFVGIGMIGYTVFTGIKTEQSGGAGAPVDTYPDTHIQARFATNENGETVFSDLDIDFDDPETKLYVRVALASGKRAELKAVIEVWGMAGEGMRGTALIQGDWLVGFTPTMGAVDTSPHLR